MAKKALFLTYFQPFLSQKPPKMSQIAILARNTEKRPWIAQKKAKNLYFLGVKVAGRYLEKLKSYTFFP